jgi:hypothetical protein
MFCALKRNRCSVNLTATKILFACSTSEYAVMLRHEASLTDEKDASYLSINVAQKDCSKWQDCSTYEMLTFVS